jgi:sec-independent protein translocase protein TatB
LKADAPALIPQSFVGTHQGAGPLPSVLAKTAGKLEEIVPMFEFDAGKLIIIGIVALIVIGPKEFPRVMIQLGQAAAKMRRMAAEFRAQFMEAMRESGVEDIKSDVAALAESAKSDAGADPLAQIKAELKSVMEAAEKPATGGGDHYTPAAEAGAEISSLSVKNLPHLSEPAEAEPETGTPVAIQSQSLARATDDEMRALAEALKAEMGGAAPGHGNAGATAAHGKV